VIVGAGLLGGSLLAALQPRRRSATDAALHLTAVSSAPTLDGLRSRQWCDAYVEHARLAESCVGADLVLLGPYDSGATRGLIARQGLAMLVMGPWTGLADGREQIRTLAQRLERYSG
jgi:hypothetical protein